MTVLQKVLTNTIYGGIIYTEAQRNVPDYIKEVLSMEAIITIGIIAIISSAEKFIKKNEKNPEKFFRNIRH